MQTSIDTSLAAKVEFLREPARYPDSPTTVDVVETHFAWVFLSDLFAYKLKKPVEYRDLYLLDLEARRADCELEVALNRRLARPTYLGIIPLTITDSELRLEGTGTAIEWLVKMRRLPAQQMLISAARDSRITPADLRALMTKLARFYRTSVIAPWSADSYPDLLRMRICDYGRQLSCSELPSAPSALEPLVDAQCQFVESHSEMLEDRIRQRRVVDAHGDLRPEHVFLGEDPQIIDCLEFKRDLRLLDSAAEVVFLGLECERLGYRGLAETIQKLYLDFAEDRAHIKLLNFYRSVAALGRALVSAWRLSDVDPGSVEPWIRRAHWYIDAAQASIDDALP